jgi:hypothetical protein
MTNVGPPLHSETHKNILIYLINIFKDQNFYHLNSANELQLKVKNNKLTIQLKNIITFSFTY